MSREINNHEDILDSRDIIARIDDLTEELTSLEADVSAAETEKTLDEAKSALGTWDASEEAEELKVLKALQAEAEGSPDWRHGETLIRDSYFREYAEQLADDVCDMKSASAWPFCHIDWEAAADALKADYFSVDYDGVEYWIRS